MSNQLKLSRKDYDAIKRHLFQGSKEQVVFGFCSTESSEDSVVFELKDTYFVRPTDFLLQSEYHVTLTDEAQGRIIKRAWDSQTALVELHSHPNPAFRAKFSESDLSGFKDFVPHVWWRLKGQPYMAIVFAPHGFDALVWRTDPGKAESLRGLEIGRETKHPTGLTIISLRGPFYGQRSF